MSIFKHKNTQNEAYQSTTEDLASKKSRRAKITVGVASLALLAGGTTVATSPNTERSKPVVTSEEVPQVTPSGTFTNGRANYDNGKIPGDPNVPADQDKGTPDGLSYFPPESGESGPLYPVVSELLDIHTLPAEVGVGPKLIDPNGSAQAPNTDNLRGTGGSVDPNTL